MTPQVYYSQQSLINAANSHLDEVDVVTFDMFDTLLLRRTHDPDLIKLPVARFISKIARKQGLDWDWKQVQIARDDCEKAMRQRTGERFKDQEACYPVFMQALLEKIFGENLDLTLLERVTDYELQMESAMLVPRKEIVAWLKSLAQQGKRVVVISDIYLPSENLKVLLDRAGILAHVEAVVSSADSFLAKASGEAYRHVAKQFDLTPERWLHIGDNPISDGFRAVESEIRSLVLQDSEEFRRRAIAARQYFYSYKRGYWKGRALQQLMAPLEAENTERSAMYAEGYNFIGPLLCMFIHYIAERCLEEKINKVFFLSREGWMFKQIWEKITPLLYPADDLPEIEYLYVSRQALAGASCGEEGLTQEKADIVFLPPGNRSFRDVCRVFSLNPEPLIEHLMRYELDLESILSPAHEGFTIKNRQQLEFLIRDQQFQTEIKRQSKNANLALQDYLESVDFFKQDNVALVDIGWLGTIQRFFSGAIQHRSDMPNLHGMLFGATRGIPYPTTHNNLIEGFIYDRQRFDFASSAVLYARDLFEEACRAPHPTLNAYGLDDNGKHQLQFRQMEDAIGQGEQAQDAYYADLQQAVLDAADRFAAASLLINPDTTGYRGWINYLLVSKLAFPKRKEINNIRHLHHLDDFHGAHQPRKSRRPKFVYNPWEVAGFKQWISCRLLRYQFRKHLKSMINY